MLFHEKMEKINGIVDQLEKEQIPLEDALALFEEGVTLIKECQSFLKETEQKITVINESAEEVPFNNESNTKEG
jgi:exodeoxyribonuclease VII small subunit